MFEHHTERNAILLPAHFSKKFLVLTRSQQRVQVIKFRLFRSEVSFSIKKKKAFYRIVKSETIVEVK